MCLRAFAVSHGCAIRSTARKDSSRSMDRARVVLPCHESSVHFTCSCIRSLACSLHVSQTRTSRWQVVALQALLCFEMSSISLSCMSELEARGPDRHVVFLGLSLQRKCRYSDMLTRRLAALALGCQQLDDLAMHI